MKKTLFLELVQKAHKLSSMYTLADIVREECEELDVRAYPHRGFLLRSLTSTVIMRQIWN